MSVSMPLVVANLGLLALLLLAKLVFKSVAVYPLARCYGCRGPPSNRRGSVGTSSIGPADRTVRVSHRSGSP